MPVCGVKTCLTVSLTDHPASATLFFRMSSLMFKLTALSQIFFKRSVTVPSFLKQRKLMVHKLRQDNTFTFSFLLSFFYFYFLLVC